MTRSTIAQGHTEFAERMKIEKIILSVAATLVGLLVAFLAFYFFQSTQTKPPSDTKTINLKPPSPTPTPTNFLTLTKPKDEEVVSDKTITVSGKTASDAVITILTNGVEDIITTSSTGDFSTTTTLLDGQNTIEVIAIFSNGQTNRIKRTITFSTEEF